MSLIRTEEKGSVNLLFSIGHQINSESMILPFILVLALFDFDNVLLWTYEISLVSHKIWFCDAIDIFYYLNTRLFLFLLPSSSIHATTTQKLKFKNGYPCKTSFLHLCMCYRHVNNKSS